MLEILNNCYYRYKILELLIENIDLYLKKIQIKCSYCISYYYHNIYTIKISTGIILEELKYLCIHMLSIEEKYSMIINEQINIINNNINDNKNMDILIKQNLPIYLLYELKVREKQKNKIDDKIIVILYNHTQILEIFFKILLQNYKKLINHIDIINKLLNSYFLLFNTNLNTIIKDINKERLKIILLQDRQLKYQKKFIKYLKYKFFNIN